MEADIVEIPPPVHLLKKRKRAILHDVIDIDDDYDSDDVVIIGANVSKSNKGKTIEVIQQAVEASDGFGSKNHGMADARKVLQAGNPPAATNFKSAKKTFGRSSSYRSNSKHERLRRFQSFKQFDTVIDASDHHFIRKNSSMKQHPKNWAKVIQKEWGILEKGLPDSIFVRAYESRMDLLRAVIIGAEGTPYHDGLFFFDVHFPSGYPNVPPLVYFDSRGFSLNPNFDDDDGQVCLSLLNTWYGSGNECWLPHVSTILQVLVSIQGLILNRNPFFNIPGRELMESAEAESMSLKYNEDTFLKSLWIMMNMIRKPPKNFEDFVVGHFLGHAHDILVACKAYMEGAQVGCLIKGGVQDVDEGDKSCSQRFKNVIAARMEVLVKEFGRIGAKDCKKFL